MNSSWTPDILGDPWVASSIDLGGGQVATLVRYDGAVTARADGTTGSILYVHGFLDYFFQDYLGAVAAEHGYRWFALDLPGCGRSQGDDPIDGEVRDLRVYAPALDAGARIVRAEAGGPLVALGHSTGGLIAPLWANARPGAADALVLNSPWLDLPVPRAQQPFMPPIVELVAAVAPQLPMSALDPHYARRLHTSGGGTWGFDPAWKPLESTKVTAGFLRAITRGQRAVHRGLAVDCPVLVCTSDSSVSGKHSTAHMDTADAVLGVADMWRHAPKIGPDVTIQVIPDGVHDLALSLEPARTTYVEAVFGWLAERLG